MNEEFELFEEKETIETLLPYGNIISDYCSFRFVILIQDGNVTTEYQRAVIRNNDDYEYEECEPFDINFKELNLSEIKRLERTLNETSNKNL